MSGYSDHPLELSPAVRELVALSALPAVGATRQRHRFRRGVADILLRSLDAEFVFFRMSVGPNTGEVEGVRIARAFTPSVHIDAVRDAIPAHFIAGDGASPAAVPDPFRDGETVRVAVQWIGPDAATGVLVAASQRPDFPSVLVPPDRLMRFPQSWTGP